MRDENGRFIPKPAVTQMAEEQFIERFKVSYGPILGTEVVKGVVFSACTVEGGYMFWNIMEPYAKDMYGDVWDIITEG